MKFIERKTVIFSLSKKVETMLNSVYIGQKKDIADRKQRDPKMSDMTLSCVISVDIAQHRTVLRERRESRGLFLKRPGKFAGPKANFKINIF